MDRTYNEKNEGQISERSYVYTEFEQNLWKFMDILKPDCTRKKLW